ncbi:hypothetical protein SAMN05421820_113108 [Pedobacter steynii]|uniref:Rhodanese domain-containing protein n=1 Tax=Pedobacter steynii TaxID=430522 RepID=A0A1H0ICE2_9SPHI|nr:hypothetical protein [Pedobacter steynii]SDO28930.1 hypothetical protein SAMN05421820_113108 [Pedobacter steynii]
MKNTIFQTMFLTLLMVCILTFSRAQVLPSTGATLQKNTWTTSQLMKPETLVKMIRTGQKVKIYNIGVVQNIKGAVNMGAAGEKENLKKFAQVLKGVPANTTLVVYCGCCPMDKCPNIRPAFQLLNDLKFKNARLLELPVNVKTDWIDKGYPLAENTK